MTYKKGNILITLGLLLVAAALSLTVYNLYDGFRAEQAVNQAVSILEEQMPAQTSAAQSGYPDQMASADEIEVPDYLLNPEMEMPAVEVEELNYIGVLRIPVLGLELPVCSQWSYPKLKKAPCRYTGSVYRDTLVVAAHNYRSHFGTLKNLSQGDGITFTDMDGNEFHYQVAALEVLPPTAVEDMAFNGYDLTLFTCTVGGASRVTVRCDRVDQREETEGGAANE